MASLIARRKNSWEPTRNRRWFGLRSLLPFSGSFLHFWSRKAAADNSRDISRPGKQARIHKEAPAGQRDGRVSSSPLTPLCVFESWFYGREFREGEAPAEPRNRYTHRSNGSAGASPSRMRHRRGQSSWFQCEKILHSVAQRGGRVSAIISVVIVLMTQIHFGSRPGRCDRIDGNRQLLESLSIQGSACMNPKTGAGSVPGACPPFRLLSPNDSGK